VIVLCAPSEGKTPPEPGTAPVDLDTLAYPELGERRRAAVDKLERVSATAPKRALAVLGLSPGQAGELERNRDLLAAPAAPAHEVYTGVLYQHLAYATLPAAARRRAQERLFVASALWGVVSLADRIPAYRLSMGASLPRVANLAAWWRPALAKALPADAFVVDLRSASYAAAWRPREGTVVEVKAFDESSGTRRPISHMAKAVRGEVARLIAGEARAPETPEDVAQLVERAGERVELTPPPRTGTAWTLAVVRG
jgi:cytoplasmic iron level regulating protein YaaA (DUF328/UPF0246 family)